MLLRRKLTIALTLALSAGSASASPVAYAIDLYQQFGTVNLGSGAFTPIGSPMAEGGTGLVTGPNGSLLTLTYAGNLASINPATGAASIVGPTGLADCTSPASPCGPTSAGIIGKFGSTIYATDLSNNLYSVNPASGVATLIGPTGIPALPFGLFDVNADGTSNIFDETLFESGGKLFATFDAARIDFATFAVTPVLPANLYQIDPLTGLATLIAPTSLSLSAALDVDGTTYAFNANKGQLVTLNLQNGNTSFISDVDPSVGLIGGATGVPEPSSILLAGVGVLGLSFLRRRGSRSGRLRE